MSPHPLRFRPLGQDRRRLTWIYRRHPGIALRLHVHLPLRPAAGPRPAILLIHGGGWTYGTPDHFLSQARRLCAEGWICLRVEYRTGSRHRASPQDAVDDVRRALAAVHRRARELGIDPRRIALWGGSAGGHLALMCCLGDAPRPPRPAALVLLNPVADASAAGFPEGASRLGPDPTRWSPLHRLAAGLPPALLVHGTADRTVPFAGAAAFAARAEALGSLCRLIPYRGCDHGFFNPGRTPGAWAGTLADARRFLGRLRR